MYDLGNIKIEVLEDYESMSKKAAELISAEILKKPNIVLGLATGSTPIGTYKQLIKMYEDKKVDFSKVTTFNLDEYFPIDNDNDQSYHYFMKEQLFDHINIDQSKTDVPNGASKDVETECINYEAKIKKAGGVDLQVLGIGLNGHIGFNEPNEFFDGITHLVDLNESTIEANSRLFESIDQVPKKAISMGIKTILMSKKIVLLVNGEKKANIIKETVLGPITPQVPASALQLHQDVTIILDQDAFKVLKDYLK